LREPGAYIQESASAVANTVAQFSSNAEETHAAGATEVNVAVNENGAASNVQTESTTDVSAQTSSEVQVDSTLNVETIFPEVLGLDTGAVVDTQIQTDASLESELEDEDLDLSLWQQLGLSLGFDIEDEE
jgi:hypothetical protein